ncbi:MAG: CIA30 family protein, partial [Akkermansiaceae bacterium]|nr:CIA30 family protein [Akkermansiaceae bacterium]
GGGWKLKDWKGMVLKVRGDGRTYDLRLTTDERFRNSAVSFRARFETAKGEWTVVKVPFSELKAGWRGRELDRKFDPARIEGIGIIVADKKAGP